MRYKKIGLVVFFILAGNAARADSPPADFLALMVSTPADGFCSILYSSLNNFIQNSFTSEVTQVWKKVGESGWMNTATIFDPMTSRSEEMKFLYEKSDCQGAPSAQLTRVIVNGTELTRTGVYNLAWGVKEKLRDAGKLDLLNKKTGKRKTKKSTQSKRRQNRKTAS